MNPLLHTSYHAREINDERVVGIEYLLRGSIWLPFSVFTTDRARPSEWLHGYDFEYCKRDDSLYYNLSSSGSSFYVNGMVSKASEPVCALWWDTRVVRPTDCTQQRRYLNPKGIKAMGYKILNDPLPLERGEINPFEVASHGTVEYCSRCKDYLPSETDHPCTHIFWCDKCSMFSKPGDRCRHRMTN